MTFKKIAELIAENKDMDLSISLWKRPLTTWNWIPWT